MSSGAVDAEKEAVEAEKEAEIMVCANCGITQVDDIKLKICCDCDLVLCGSEWCRIVHREQHKEDCQKRKAELRDKELFEQPDGTHLGECPLCFLPMPIDLKKSSFYSCCCKTVCKGCIYADVISNGHSDNCPFCREPTTDDKEDNIKRVMERVKVNDPAAIKQIGLLSYDERDYDRAIEYFRKAAELGDAASHNSLGTMYLYGQGVEKDLERGFSHLEKAAIGGHPYARYNLGCIDSHNGNIERAVKHFIISAKLGDGDSMKELWKCYSAGNITKKDLDVTLRGHKAAIDARKSSDREAAEDVMREIRETSEER
jgi:tetratricopeptide (TPR) repeat protein